MFISAAHLDPPVPTVMVIYPPPPSFSSRIKANPATLISFLLAPAVTGPQWPSLAGCVCVFVDVCGGSALVVCTFTWLQSACDREHACMRVCVCVWVCVGVWRAALTWLCVIGVASGVVCFLSVSGFRDSGICLPSSLLWHVLWLLVKMSLTEAGLEDVPVRRGRETGGLACEQ